MTVAEAAWDTPPRAHRGGSW